LSLSVVIYSMDIWQIQCEKKVTLYSHKLSEYRQMERNEGLSMKVIMKTCVTRV